MIKKISFILILFILLEIPALCAVEPKVLVDDVTVWSDIVELKSDIIVPEGKTLIIKPGTKIYGVYEYKDDQFTPDKWRIIVKGNLIASGEANNSVIIDSMPYGLSSVRIPVDSQVENITISPQIIDTNKIRDEFTVFRWQYLGLWTLLFASIYYAIKTR